VRARCSVGFVPGRVVAVAACARETSLVFLLEADTGGGGGGGGGGGKI
jgi:hypothetical protein